MRAFVAGPLIRPQLNVKQILLGRSGPKVRVTQLDWATHMTTAVKSTMKFEMTWLTLSHSYDNSCQVQGCNWAAHTTTALIINEMPLLTCVRLKLEGRACNLVAFYVIEFV